MSSVLLIARELYVFPHYIYTNFYPAIGSSTHRHFLSTRQYHSEKNIAPVITDYHFKIVYNETGVEDA